MSWVGDVLGSILRFRINIDLSRSSKTAKLILATEVDTFSVCQPHKVRQKRPLFLPDRVVICHLRADDELTVTELF